VWAFDVATVTPKNSLDADGRALAAAWSGSLLADCVAAEDGEEGAGALDAGAGVASPPVWDDVRVAPHPRNKAMQNA